MNRLSALLLLAAIAPAACDRPPLPAPSALSAASGAKSAKLALSDEDDSARPQLGSKAAAATRPALLQKRSLQQVLGSALGSVRGGDSAAVVEDSDDDADVAAEAPSDGGEDRSALISQLFTLGLILLFRVGIAVWKSMRARGIGADAIPGGAALASVQAALYRSPLGPALTAVGQLWEKVAEFARSPNAAPVMLGLVILSMKLVKRMGPPDDEEPLVVQATAEPDDADDADDDAAEEESDGEAAMEAAAEEEEEEVDEVAAAEGGDAEDGGAEDEEDADDPYD